MGLIAEAVADVRGVFEKNVESWAGISQYIEGRAALNAPMVLIAGPAGSGKTTLARLLAAQLAPMEGDMAKSGKMRVGYFTQYQVEELHGDDTPLEHMTRVMTGKTPAAVRAQLGRFGFSGDRAVTKVGKLSGGERARLALALITRDAPHMLILDEPTNHLDVDAREALVQALVVQAQARGVTTIDTGESAPVYATEESAHATSACEGLIGVCYLALYLGLSFMHTWWLLLWIISGALLLFLFFWELHYSHAHPLVHRADSVLAKK